MDERKDNAAGKTWISIVEAAPDDSGDVVISIPDDLMDELGWQDDTPLEIAVVFEERALMIYPAGQQD